MTCPATFCTGGGFVAGTRVHTKEGLVPIEKLKVGDWVLSKPVFGKGEQAYKQVVNAFVFQEKETWLVSVMPLAESERAERTGTDVREECRQTFVVTPNHFFCANLGWTRADELDVSGPEQVELSDGEFGYVSESSRIFRTVSDDIGWIYFEDADGGQNVDCRCGTPFTVPLTRGLIGNPGVDWRRPVNEFLRTTYNIEVEDYHTYYVGEQGVWVHACTTRKSA
jgi:hypothetical protein